MRPIEEIGWKESSNNAITKSHPFLKKIKKKEVIIRLCLKR